jgi:thiol-disulfide isomerase/thioredoxin
MKRTSILVVGVLLIAAGAASAQGMKRDSGPAAPGNAMMAADPAKAVFDLRGMAPGVIPFTSEAAAQALAARRRVVYFFAASWCPTCRAAYRDLKANAAAVPPDAVIVVVDYDKAAELKTKYGVSYQHTFVAIGPGGEAKKTWSGSLTVKEIVGMLPDR